MEINSVSREVAQSTENTKATPCKHFSIRGFVGAMRQKNWKMTSPFMLDESKEQPLLSLPPLVARRFRNWRCDNCVEQVKAEANCEKEERNLGSNGIQEAPMSNSTCPRIEIDLNKPIEIDSDSDDSDSDPIPTNNENQCDTKVEVGRIPDHETSLENNLNQEVPNVSSFEQFPSPMQGVVNPNKRGSEGNVISDIELDISLENNLNHEVPINPSLQVCPNPIQEVMHTIKRGSEVNVISNMELDSINLNKDRGSPEVSEGRPMTEHNQCQTKEIIMREVEAVAKDNVIENTTEQFPPEPMTEEVNVSTRDMDNNNVETDHVLDHHTKKSTLRSRKKQRKMRFLDEIFRQNDEANTKQITITQSPLNVPSQTMSAIPDKVVIVEAEKKVTKRGRERKRKPPPISKKSKDADMSLKRVETQVQNTKEKDAKRKGKVLVESNKELNYKVVEDSFALKEVQNVPNMSVSTVNPPKPNGKGLEEGLHLSSNIPSLGLVRSHRSSPQPEFQLPFPWPFQEGTSTWRPIKRGGGINLFGQQSYPSKRSIDDTSGKGKGILIEEIDEDRSKNASTECSNPSSMKNFIDLTQEDDNNESGQHSVDDIIKEVPEISNHFLVDEAAMEVAEIMITSLPANGILENTPQKENLEAITHEEINGITTRGENDVIPRNEIPINYHSFGNPFGLSNLYSTHSPYRFALLPSKEAYISPTKDANNNFGVSQTSRFNWGIPSSSNHTLHVEENDHNPTFQIDTTKPMSLNNRFLRYDEKLKKIVSHPPRKDMTFPPFDSMPIQEKKVEIDLNQPCSDEITEPETLNENIGVGTMRKKSLEAAPNQKQCFDLNSTEPTPNMNGSIILHPASKKSSPAPLCVGSNNAEMQRRTLKGFDGVNVNRDGNMSMFGNGKMNGSASAPFTQNSKLFGWLDCEIETPLSVTLNTVVSEKSCEINRNPADFSVPEPGNPFMNDDGEEEEQQQQQEGVEGNASNKRRASTFKHGESKKRKRNSKKR
ncbi:hypothetical protein VNO77_30589 [Canavalia gladiata]|uniref:Uncharacterized protein n=1 Tax=Canavalia gladiata TaxID=3824 RepID=A0AAN9KNK2_CANGL